jgi:hypothetical protein
MARGDHVPIRGKERSVSFRGSRSLWATLVLTLALVLVPAVPGMADEGFRTDPRDTPGRLDLRRIGHAHRGGDELVHRITTYRRFPSSILTGRTVIGMVLWDANSAEIWVITIRWRRDALRAIIYHFEDDGNLARSGKAEVSRPNRKTVKVIVSEDQIANPSRYLWQVFASFRATPRCREEQACFDETGPLRHRL